MPNLARLWEWRRFEPGIGGNRELPEGQRFYFEVAIGLTWVELEAFKKATSFDIDTAAEQKELEDALTLPEAEREAKATDVRLRIEERLADRFAEAIDPYVRFGKEPLSLDGKPITKIRDYLRAVSHQLGSLHAMELFRALVDFNTLEGSRELFSKRSSGGASGTSHARSG